MARSVEEIIDHLFEQIKEHFDSGNLKAVYLSYVLAEWEKEIREDERSK